MSEQERDDRGWPVDEHGKRVDPIGRYLDSLTPEQRQAWGATCSLDAPRITIQDGQIVVVYP